MADDTPEESSIKEVKVLRTYYGKLRRAMTDSADAVALDLISAGLIAGSTLDEIHPAANKVSKVSKLLRGVTSAVEINPRNFRKFLLVLNDYPPLLNEVAKSMEQDYETKVIQVPAEVYNDYDQMQGKLGTLFFKFQQAIERANVSLEDLKQYIIYCRPHDDCKEELRNAENISKLLEIVRAKLCSLVNYPILDDVAENFKLVEAQEFIQAYREQEENYRKKLNDFAFAAELQKENDLLKHQKRESNIILKLKRPQPPTISEFEKVLKEVFHKLYEYIHIRKVDPGSIIVKMWAPERVIKALIKMAKDKETYLRDFGATKLTIGETIIFDDDEPDYRTWRHTEYKPREVLIIGSFGNHIYWPEKQHIVSSKKQSTQESDEWMTEIEMIKTQYGNNTQEYHLHDDVLDLPGDERSKNYYLEYIKKVFINCKQPGVIIYYTGHGEKNTGNWCFKDGVITFNDVFNLYKEHFEAKQLTIISDCSYSGNWITECANRLDEMGIPSCGHQARKSNILLSIIASCQCNEEATFLCYVNEAVEYIEDIKVVKFHCNTKLTQQTPVGVDFRLIRCGNKDIESCEADSDCTWKDCVTSNKYNIVPLSTSINGIKLWVIALIDKEALANVETEAAVDQLKVINSYYGEKIPENEKRKIYLQHGEILPATYN